MGMAGAGRKILNKPPASGGGEVDGLVMPGSNWSAKRACLRKVPGVYPATFIKPSLFNRNAVASHSPGLSHSDYAGIADSYDWCNPDRVADEKTLAIPT